MIHINLYKDVIRIHAQDKLIADSRRIYLCDAALSEEWRGMDVRVYFRNGDKQFGILLDGMNAAQFEIPWEVLEDPGKLWLGAIGSDAEGRVRNLPEAIVGMVYAGTDAESAEAPKLPTPKIVDTLIETARSAYDAAMNVKYDLNAQGSIHQPTDLTEKFAREIADYGGDPWAWIKGRITRGDYSGLYIGDYIPFTTSNGHTFRARIMGIDTYYMDRRSSNVEPIPHHIDFITKEVWPEAFQMNLSRFNNGVLNVNGSDQKSAIPWVASHGYYYMNSLAGKVVSNNEMPLEFTDVDYTGGGVYYYLPQALKDVIVEKRGTFYYRYSSNSLSKDDDAVLYDKVIGKLWLPEEMEVVGYHYNATFMGLESLFVQYPLFRDSKWNMACTLDGVPVYWWWMNAAYWSTGSFVLYAMGMSNQDFANSNHYAPICFRVAQG